MRKLHVTDSARGLKSSKKDAKRDEQPIEQGPTLAELMRDYEASPDWKKLAKSTKAIERFHMMAIEAEFGHMKLSAIEERGSRAPFLAWRDALADRHPRAADAKLGRLQTILKFGCDREKLARNPLASFKRVYQVDRSEVIWLPEHFQALNASKASAPMKFAALLALHTGQRRGDLIALRWRQYDGAGITLVQSKSRRRGLPGRRVYIPATKALKAALDALRAALAAAKPGEDVGELPILMAARGALYTPNGFRLAWRRAFAAACIKPVKVDDKTFDLHFHDIRGTAVTMLAEAGCTIPEISAITGHKLASATRILERYLGSTKTMADSAIAKLELRLAEMPMGAVFHSAPSDAD